MWGDVYVSEHEMTNCEWMLFLRICIHGDGSGSVGDNGELSLRDNKYDVYTDRNRVTMGGYICKAAVLRYLIWLDRV